ncbi:MAG: electron transport complex subunit RsxC [Azospira oryzae]|nr:MAG: electron transport complex subunit RsxC [Azospira oryzae]PZP81931.1 MAG: electron transport complex subunit RsxC [Azospira oryzae]
MRRLHRFHGGLKLEDHKAISTARPIEPLPLPSELVVPLAQHIGAAAKPLVSPGERVLKGQLIGLPEGYVSCGVHAPTSGRVLAVEPRRVPHPSGLSDLCVVIEPDGQERWVEREPIDYLNADPSEVRNRIRQAGLAGLGGAVFPSFIKLNPGANTVRTLVVNGAECEPYITCDDMLMRARAPDIVAGIEIARHLLGAIEVLIGIEDNKPEAIAAMRMAVQAGGHAFEIVPVPSIYPAGGEKQLLYTLTGLEVPSGKRPHDIGLACFNVGSLYALARAVLHGEPLISRITTITGNVDEPRNVEALIGTPVAHLAAAGRPRPDTDAYVMGGPMMGFVLPGPDVPVVKATNCVIARSPALFPPLPVPMPCIRCGRCAEVCPARLAPMDLYAFAKSQNFGKAQEYSLFDCIECGCCSAVCPSHIPLVDYYRYAKSEIWARERERKAADLARRRHEFRLARLEREQQERARRLAEKTGGTSQASPDREAILAAIEQAKSRKARPAAETVEQGEVR